MHNGAYPFVWPRDGIYAAMTFARTGYTNESYRFYKWLRDTASRDTDSGIGDKGFFHQKYTTDGYRIWTAPQVDETASVPWGLWQHYLITGHGGFLNDFWNLAYTSARASSEDSALDSRLNYNDTFNLVDSMNCWEDSFGLFLYSNGSVVRGLRDAANIADHIPGRAPGPTPSATAPTPSRAASTPASTRAWNPATSATSAWFIPTKSMRPPTPG